MYSSRGLKEKLFGDPHQKRAQTWERTNEWVKQHSDVTYTDCTLVSDHVQSQKSKGKLYSPNYARNQREIMIPSYRVDYRYSKVPGRFNWLWDFGGNHQRLDP